jgi:hypothetical protein
VFDPVDDRRRLAALFVGDELYSGASVKIYFSGRMVEF